MHSRGARLALNADASFCVAGCARGVCSHVPAHRSPLCWGLGWARAGVGRAAERNSTSMAAGRGTAQAQRQPGPRGHACTCRIRPAGTYAEHTRWHGGSRAQAEAHSLDLRVYSELYRKASEGVPANAFVDREEDIRRTATAFQKDGSPQLAAATGNPT